MQPNLPSRPGHGPGLVVGLLVLLAFVYVMDHAGKGEAAVFSGVERHISGADFRGAQCTAVFGGCKIDLRDAQIQGREAVLNTYAIFGGVEIWVPEDWEVVNHGVVLFGGMDDHRRRPPKGPDTKTLILDGATIFGGTDVKN
jgi:hypothetical protein